MPQSATHNARLRELQAELEAHVTERERLEAGWMEVAEAIEG
ncbi:hypothetical protein [Pseudonocardia sp.]